MYRPTFLKRQILVFSVHLKLFHFFKFYFKVEHFGVVSSNCTAAVHFTKHQSS